MKFSAAGIAVAMTALAAVGPAQARDRDAAIAAGAIGGLALGAVLGSALAAPPPPGYYPPPRRVYVPADDVECGYHRVPLYDEYGDPAGYKRVPNRC